MSVTKKPVIEMKFLIVLSLIFGVKTFAQIYAGPYSVDIYQLGDCGGNPGTWNFSTKITRVNRTMGFYNCNCTIGDGINSNHMLILNFAKFGNGGWRPNFLTLQLKDVCKDGWKVVGTVVARILRDAGYTKGCPVPPGKYYIRNHFVAPPEVATSMPVFPYGKYRLDIDFRRKDNRKRSGCLSMFMAVVPKKLG